MSPQRSGRFGRLHNGLRWTFGLLASAVVVALLLQAARDEHSPGHASNAKAYPPSSVAPAARPLKATTSAPAGTAGSTAATTSRFRVASSDPLIEAFTRELLSQGGSPVQLSDPEARCVAFGLLDRLGADVLATIGTQTPPGAPLDISKLSVPQQEQYAAALVDCVDVRLTLANQLGAAGLTPGDISCVADQVTQDGTLAEVLRKSVVGGLDAKAAEQALTGPMAEALQRCQPGNDLKRAGQPD